MLSIFSTRPKVSSLFPSIVLTEMMSPGLMVDVGTRNDKAKEPSAIVGSIADVWMEEMRIIPKEVIPVEIIIPNTPNTVTTSRVIPTIFLFTFSKIPFMSFSDYLIFGRGTRFKLKIPSILSSADVIE